LVTRIDGKLHATPLLLALIAIETADIIFAVDSVPAIFAITHEPFIVYTSNVFAILGLRSMYFSTVWSHRPLPPSAVRTGNYPDFCGIKNGLVKRPVGWALPDYNYAHRYRKRSRSVDYPFGGVSQKGVTSKWTTDGHMQSSKVMMSSRAILQAPLQRTSGSVTRCVAEKRV